MNVSTKKDTTKDKNINFQFVIRFSKSETHFLGSANRNTMQQNLVQIYFLSQEVGVSGNSVEKEPQTLRPKLKKYRY